MPRLARRVAVDYPHHITQRGNNREQVFLDSADYKKYLSLLSEFTQRYQVEIWSYCLMPNHIHLLAVPRISEGLSRGIGLTNMTYTQYFNRRYLRSGRIWQNRFFSCVVCDNRYLWNVARYIENNPVKGGLTEAAAEYKWSSAKTHCQGDEDAVLNGPGWLCDEMQKKYLEYLGERDEYVDESIRHATSTGKPFGGHFPKGNVPIRG